MRDVVAYCRSACEEPGTSSSAYRQAQMIRRYAKRRGLTISETYIDPGVSGATLKRPELRRLIADCRAGKVGTIITKDPARLSRDYGQLAKLLHILEKTGVRIEFAAPATPDAYAYLKNVLVVLAELDEACSNPKQRRTSRRRVRQN